TGQQSTPSVAVDAGGDFVIAWGSEAQDGGVYGVFARRYNSVGGSLGAEFRVNSYTTNAQAQPVVAMEKDGRFVVAWVSYLQDGSYFGVFGQRYSSSGVAQGAEFRVNTYTTGSQQAPHVSFTGNGRFLITWMGNGNEPVDNVQGTYARQYDASGVPQ